MYTLISCSILSIKRYSNVLISSARCSCTWYCISLSSSITFPISDNYIAISIYSPTLSLRLESFLSTMDSFSERPSSTWNTRWSRLDTFTLGGSLKSIWRFTEGASYGLNEMRLVFSCYGLELGFGRLSGGRLRMAWDLGEPNKFVLSYFRAWIEGAWFLVDWTRTFGDSLWNRGFFSLLPLEALQLLAGSPEPGLLSDLTCSPAIAEPPFSVLCKNALVSVNWLFIVFIIKLL